ncbi:hypothetical protein BJ684DRAFT_21544 [Piptocephalis cylindrospora]|uniref:Superoxide dismutase copper/zinc binding domain-containing protein n=1 Tax=Piptocephalis cylindrospora TaxID=1907219 RepID=A0A4P9Y1E3_9FUNG|nr:hypothetical protein BJ684DRAFT_21544 [Piptocephalis cylindrospora]|eukprot:RKP11881.1 hypothetical protein BJ684DRAFT_21544 [Piptocephalis cylindrospora]
MMRHPSILLALFLLLALLQPSSAAPDTGKEESFATTLLQPPSTASDTEKDDAFAAAARIRGKGLHGMAFFYRLRDEKSMRFFMSLQEETHSKGSPSSSSLPPTLAYAVHEQAVPTTGKCIGLGRRLDPFHIRRSQPPSPRPVCTASDAHRSCELGDLSGKYGQATISPPGGYYANGTDPDLTITGPYGVVGRSFVVNGPNGDIIACSTITDAKDVDYSTASSAPPLFLAPMITSWCFCALALVNMLL